MHILGIETSCDETAAAIVREGGSVVANVIHSQVEQHARYGGVVPELASREHILWISRVIASALEQADMAVHDLDGIAVTSGPGLVGALLVGISVAKGMALAAGLPLIGVHHLEGHLMAPFLKDSEEEVAEYPFVALLVSGGHTQLLEVSGFGNYRLLGQTRDDAVGEAFDKGAKMLNLDYPGGPAIARLARDGDPDAISFPRVLLDRKAFDFSFSGLKTALRRYLMQSDGDARSGRSASAGDIAASYQEAIVETLIFKALAACHACGLDRLVVAGGVGANERLRSLLRKQCVESGVRVLFPPPLFCTDNGAMIALAGLNRLKCGDTSTWLLEARPNWPIEMLSDRCLIGK